MPLETSYKMSTSSRVWSHGWIGQACPSHVQLDNQPAQPTARHHCSFSLQGRGMPLGLCSYVCGKLSTKLQHGFARLLIWMKGYLVQQTRPQGMAYQVTCCALSLQRTFGGCEAALLGWAMPPLDDQPCTWCGQDHDSPSMILCNQCNHCYHKDCAT